MAYTLSQFCKDANAILKSQPQAAALPKVAERLSELLQSAVRRRDLQRRHAGRQARAVPRSRA